MQRRDMLDRNSMAVGLACIEYNGKKFWIQEFDNKIVTQTPITDMDTEEEHTVYVDRETVSLYLKFNDDIYLTQLEINKINRRIETLTDHYS
jgi:ABC-type sulfate transport system substrate-binding protein